MYKFYNVETGRLISTWMGEFYGDFMGLSNNEISVNETENDNEEGNDPTENLQNDTTNNDNTLGADANVLGTNVEEEL